MKWIRSIHDEQDRYRIYIYIYIYIYTYVYDLGKTEIPSRTMKYPLPLCKVHKKLVANRSNFHYQSFPCLQFYDGNMIDENMKLLGSVPFLLLVS